MHNRPTPKFSIITVTYNAEAVLEDTIQSVISQTYHHVEYIIIDGASKDRTLAIAERYRDRITLLVSEPDKGLYDAMNKGIHLATGDYLCFLNAGDSFHEDDTLQQMVHTLGIGELPDVLYGETALVDKERHFLRMRRLSDPRSADMEEFQARYARLPSGILRQTEPGGTIRYAIPLLRRLRLVHPHHEKGDAAYTASHAYRLSGRRYDDAEPKGFPAGTLPHHGEALWTDKYRGAPCMVCIPSAAEEIVPGFQHLTASNPQPRIQVLVSCRETHSFKA